MKLQIVDNGPIEIQCCQVLNKHAHNARKDNDTTQNFGESTDLKSKRDESNKSLTKSAEIRKSGHPVSSSEVVIGPDVSRSDGACSSRKSL